jgi:3',5'-cyclic-AMP phosphodiesterase
MPEMRVNIRRAICLCLLACVPPVWISLSGASVPANNFRFSIIGDRTGGATPGIYERVWREVALLDPDFVINVGDSIEGKDDRAAARQWEALPPVWSRFQGPFYLVPGNHDIWSDASRALFRKQTGREPFYSFDFQEAHFTVLDNSGTTDLAPEQLSFLERDLEANRARRPKFVFFHKPFWIAFLKLGSGEFPLHRLARQYGVDAVISGHGHHLLRAGRDGILYLEVGSSGANIAGSMKKGESFRDGAFYQHIWVSVRGAQAKFTVKELDGRAGGGRITDLADWGENGLRVSPDDPGIAAVEAK